MNVSETFQRRTRRHHVHSGTLFLMALRIDSNHVVLGKLAFCEEAVTEISSGGKIWIRSAKRRSISVQKKKAITVLSN